MTVAVKDSVLTDDMFRQVADFCAMGSFKETSPGPETSVWRGNAPLNPLVGSTLLWALGGQYPEAVKSGGDLLLYPSGSPLDAVVSAAWDQAKMQIPGAERECVGVTATIFKYGPGSRLIWHKDQASLGAFTLYVSDWSENSGGQFAYRPEGEKEGRFVEPRPNRMVVFASGLDHSVFPVAADAGNPRTSISGFFIDMQRAQTLLAGYAGSNG
jgi:hypothetical protein